MRTTNVENPLSKIFEPYSCYIDIAQALLVAHEGLKLEFYITFDMLCILIGHNNSIVEVSFHYT